MWHHDACRSKNMCINPLPPPALRTAANKAHVEDTSSKPLVVRSIPRVERGPASLLGLLTLVLRAVVQRYCFAVRPGCVGVKHEVGLGHEVADAPLDHVASVVVLIAVEVATMPVLVRRGRHPDPHIQMVLPAVDLHEKVPRQEHMHDVPRQALLRGVQELTLVVVGDLA
eukprot:CAMPEP_0177308324 /NCGR_PEP_ID=MMETSP0368-20130122/8705_1 /TAXON_ID=447022 ORGANISM="Scrippsiella hangoei-like, Strain SHHI-4" /NCGR_SAMPLE_ID=MMETSP0368 /ASSEMBLY_ACC=CAM_ASM_000363 /LENGTH=169 /DNA_ID=CAMNT_0018767129 /DNA_START=213 /DNA_END=723 /DNA_ORIENTATION=-